MNPDTRKEQLLSLAEEGDETAIADLFREFGYTFARSAQQ